MTWYGKPGKEHFEACVKLIGLPKEKCCHVGDSLHHDVKGANNSGVDCIWVVKTGIHNGEVEEKGMENVIEDEGGFKPTWIVDAFRLE